MKTITILCDGAGQFRCGYVRNPEAFRRAVSEETGAGHVLFALALIHNTHNRDCIDILQSQVLVHWQPDPRLAQCPKFLRAVVWCLFVLPVMAQLRQRLVADIARLTGLKALRRTIRRMGEARAFRSGS
jgi:hypothetical protein